MDDLAAQRVNTALIAEHWEDLLRLAGSLKLGTVLASGLIRTLQTKDRPTRLARALEELGGTLAAPDRDHRTHDIEHEPCTICDGAAVGVVAPVAAVLEELVGQIAIRAVCGLSPGHFMRALRKTCGLAPHQWLKRGAHRSCAGAAA